MAETSRVGNARRPQSTRDLSGVATQQTTCCALSCLHLCNVDSSCADSRVKQRLVSACRTAISIRACCRRLDTLESNSSCSVQIDCGLSLVSCLSRSKDLLLFESDSSIRGSIVTVPKHSTALRVLILDAIAREQNDLPMMDGCSIAAQRLCRALILVRAVASRERALARSMT